MAPKVTFDVDPTRVRTLDVDGRGRVTIPHKLRQRIGIEPHEQVDIVILGQPGEE